MMMRGKEKSYDDIGRHEWIRFKRNLRFIKTELAFISI